MKKEKTEVSVIDFTKFDIAQLPELNGKKEEIKAIVDANPIVEITDNASYELAKKSRTAVKTLRTSLEKEKKDVNDRIKNNVLLVVANEYDSLIANVKNDENARQEKVTAWEEIKENERLEKLRLEQERVDNIKNRINEFHSDWSQRISQLEFSDIEEFEEQFTKTVANYDTKSLAEFEVLFSDSWSQLTYALSERKSVLLAQENIRIQQIELAKEKERQRLEAERIAEEQRKEREKLEAEQKAEAEKIRLAKEAFEKAKREFEEKQAEAKRIEDEKAKKLLEIEVVEEVKSDQSANSLESLKDEYMFEYKPNNEEILKMASECLGVDQEATKGLSTRLKANTPAIEKELTWDDVESEFIQFHKEQMIFIPPGVFKWLSKNYNCPTRKI